MSNVTFTKSFNNKVIEAERKFIRELGVNQTTGLTIAAVLISKRTGMAQTPLPVSLKESLRDEAMHMAVLGTSLRGDYVIYSTSEALEILKKKI